MGDPWGISLDETANSKGGKVRAFKWLAEEGADNYHVWALDLYD